jgi:general secretion pathway protein G
MSSHPSLSRVSRSGELGRRDVRQRGFTIIEMLTVMTVLGALATITVTKVRAAVDQGKVARAIGDLRAIQADVMGYEASGQALPASLADVQRDGLLDPWGHPYVYVNFAVGGTPRTDRFGVQINLSFDLYSQGPDGSSSTSLTSSASQDDVVRASDGSFIGRASRY